MLKDKFDLILSGRLVRFYGLSHLVLPKDYYTVFSGSVEYPKDRKIVAITTIEDLRLRFLEDSRIIWKGDLSGVVERSGQGTIAREAAMEGLEVTMRQLQERIRKVHPSD